MPGPLDSFIDDFILLINDLKLNTGFLLLVILILVKYCLSMLILQESKNLKKFKTGGGSIVHGEGLLKRRGRVGTFPI